MRNKVLIALAIAGVLAGLVTAYIFGIEKKPQPPAFKPASNPYEKGIYANGIIESYQESGANVNVYPEVAGTVVNIMSSEGQNVHVGMPLLMMDDSLQRATVDQQLAQAESAKAQIELAKANLKNLQDQLDKQNKSYELDKRSVSLDALDTAQNAVKVGTANLDVAQKQYAASLKSYRVAKVLLSKYTILSPSEGSVLSINTAVGSYISSQGSYDSYTGSFGPSMVIGNLQHYAGVRCYIDEILINKLPKPTQMQARMFIKGTSIDIPLEYVRAQPYVTPKIELSNQRTERVDVRVLPLIFRFAKPENVSLYPGQLVDIYIGEK